MLQKAQFGCRSRRHRGHQGIAARNLQMARVQVSRTETTAETCQEADLPTLHERPHRCCCSCYIINKYTRLQAQQTAPTASNKRSPCDRKKKKQRQEHEERETRKEGRRSKPQPALARSGSLNRLGFVFLELVPERLELLSPDAKHREAECSLQELLNVSDFCLLGGQFSSGLVHGTLGLPWGRPGS